MAEPRASDAINYFMATWPEAMIDQGIDVMIIVRDKTGRCELLSTKKPTAEKISFKLGMLRSAEATIKDPTLMHVTAITPSRLI